jgi:S-formylglutathione hydrolase FrmB
LLGQSIALLARLRELRIPVTTDFYGPGTHTWPYWERELHRSLPMLLDALGRGHSGADKRLRAVAAGG